MNNRISIKPILIGSLAVLLMLGVVHFVQNWSRLTDPAEMPAKAVSPSPGEILVVLLGTGTPQTFYQRAKAGHVVLIEDKAFLVDCGGGTVMRLWEAGINPGKVNHLLFTHQHSDHNSGFLDFFITGWISSQGGRSNPLQIYGPPPTKKVIGMMRKSLDYDIALRTGHVGHNAAGSRIAFAEQIEGIIYDDSSLRITVFPVDHRPVDPAVGFRFDYNGKTVVFSGDTIPNENVRHYSRNADLLIHEAYSSSYMEMAVKRFPELENEINQVMKYHTSTLEAAEIAESAGVKQLVLTHLMPAPSQTWYFERFFTKGMRKIYKGKITLGRDLLIISI